MDSPIFGGLEIDRSLNAADNQIFNLYPELVETKQGKRVGALYATPGTKWELTVGLGPVRGMHVAPALSLLFVVSGSELYSVTTALAQTFLGTIAGSGDVWMIDNGTQVAIFSGHVGAVWSSAGGLANIALPFAANTDSITAAYIDGYGIINQPGSNIVWQSNLLDLSTWNALNFGSATGDADNVIAVAQIHRELWFLKETECEIWYNAGTAGFAFARLDGVYPQAGILAPKSLRRSMESLVWLGKNKQGEAVVVRSSGHQVQRISTHSIETMIQGATLAQLQAATAYTYQQQGHEFYVLNIADLSLCYDATESALAGVPLWHQRAVFNQRAAPGPSSPGGAPGPFVGPSVVPGGVPLPPVIVQSGSIPVFYGASADGSKLWGGLVGHTTMGATAGGTGQAAWMTLDGVVTTLNWVTGGSINCCGRNGLIGGGYDDNTVGGAFWTAGNTETFLQPAPYVNAPGAAWGMSDDGSVIVGQGEDASQTPQPYYWLSTSPSVLRRLTSSHLSGALYGIARDASVIVGQIGAASGPRDPAYWTGTGALDATALATLASPYVHGTAYRVSANGYWIVGECDSTGVIVADAQPCFWWRSAGAYGAPVALSLTAGGTTYSSGYAFDVSDDGTIMGGCVKDGSGVTWPAIWHVVGTRSTLQIMPTSNGVTTSITNIRGFVGAVSADGKIAAGGEGYTGGGQQMHGIVWRLG